MIPSPTPSIAIDKTKERLFLFGKRVEQKTWQSVKSPDDTWELLNHSFSFFIPNSIEELENEVRPNNPWAEAHFWERVGGEPLNPGEQYKNWPYFKHVGENFKLAGKFSHSYMERFWPKFAGKLLKDTHKGIRFNYGDLDDIVDLLVRDPETRQAYLPVWFPEDTGTVHGERVPCTLGYHFIIRDGYFHIVYYIRSCDFIRHFRDDIYLACRLFWWIREQAFAKTSTEHDEYWRTLKPGTFTMHITSLHCFYNEIGIIKKY
jgi:thymidylate synthase